MEKKAVIFTASLCAAGALIAGGVYYLVRGSGNFELQASGALQSTETKHKWRVVKDRHWQIISTDWEEASLTDEREGNRGQCSEGMVEVSGNMVLEPQNNPYEAGRIETMQLTTCTEWIQKEYPERCAKFDGERWREMISGLPTKPMHYCIDRFEYPNRKGQYPLIYMSWYEARDECEEQGKRLCDEDEWTFACEGEEAKPYPYGDGYTRDGNKCVTDKRWLPYNQRAMTPRDGDEAGYEMDRLWQGFPSGTQPDCKSDNGVYDMTGNVDEWTTSTRPGERPSILKGGYWGPVRTRCRPSTRSHDQNHTFYQQGNRCCTDVGAKLPRGEGEDPAAAPIPRELR